MECLLIYLVPNDYYHRSLLILSTVILYNSVTFKSTKIVVVSKIFSKVH